MRLKRMVGVTLIELMIVVAVVAILAAIAYPSFVEQVRKSRRADAKAALQALQLAEEKYRANNISYTADMTKLGYGGENDQLTADGWYEIDIVDDSASATGFLATATPQDDRSGVHGNDERVSEENVRQGVAATLEIVRRFAAGRGISQDR